MIDWDRPIETIHGEPAKLVYTRAEEVGDLRWLVVVAPPRQHPYSHWVSTKDQGNFIRNVPKPPVKVRDAVMAVMGKHGHAIAKAWVKGEAISDKFYEDMLTALSKVPQEAYERVKP